MRTGAVVLGLSLLACGRRGPIDRSAGYGGRPTTVAIRDVPVRGHDVVVETGHHDVSGELLAVSDEAIYVQTEDGPRGVALGDVRGVNVELYPSGGGAMAGWTVGGSLSTATHGFYAILTLPAWIAVGAIAAGTAGASNDVDVDPKNPIELARLYQFARFPQGWPTLLARPTPAPPEAGREPATDRTRLIFADGGFLDGGPGD